MAVIIILTVKNYSVSYSSADSILVYNLKIHMAGLVLMRSVLSCRFGFDLSV